MSQGRFRSFLTGALVGAGLGILLAPKEGQDTRNDLKKSFSLLIDTIKNIDVEETKAKLLEKVSKIKEELSNIDEKTAKEVAEEKIEIVKEKCNELMKEANKVDAPVVEKAAKSVKDSAVNLLNDFVTELESNKEEEKKKTTKKTKTTNTKKRKTKSK